ncbi:MAG: fructose-1,6-bisphosphatase [Candidatus Thermoplasmatota archaeon]|nr:fructose-1,6-bisphosphatase [Candidatus Thermoplasmatota archaeon]
MSDIGYLRSIGETVSKHILEMFPCGGGGARVGRAASGGWTKEIDQIAENIALDMINDMGLEWNVRSEEIGYLDREGQKTLIMDPIDGTYNAVNGLPFYSTSLAIMGGEGEIEAGVIYDIPMRRCFHAEKGGGAYLDADRIRTREFLESRSVFSSFLDPGCVEDNRVLLSWPRRARYFGAISLEICFVAMGSFDLFAVFSRVPRITDIAAAYLVLEEAGGKILRIDREGVWTRYRPGDESDIRGIMAIGDPASEDDLIEMSRVMRPREEV